MLLDTNILIALFNDDQKTINLVTDLSYRTTNFYVSAISVAEILALPSLSNQEVKEIKLFLKDFISVPFDDNLAELAAVIIRKYQLKLPDAFIAASALILDIPLITQDKQFWKIRELKFNQ